MLHMESLAFWQHKIWLEKHERQPHKKIAETRCK